MMKLSRSKVELFCECPRCFYLEVKLGIKRPPGFPFTLNAGIDRLLKTEFDGYRATQMQHPLQTVAGPDVVPLNDKRMNQWRTNTKGVAFFHQPHDTEYYGSIDDLWIDRATGQCFVVDYKATAKKGTVTELPDWAVGYRRQMEFYQWLLRRNGMDCSDTGYFVYTNGNAYAPAFNNTMEFDTRVIAYQGNDAWVEPTLDALQLCLKGAKVPMNNAGCDWCKYQKQTRSIRSTHHTKTLNPLIYEHQTSA